MSPIAEVGMEDIEEMTIEELQASTEFQEQIEKLERQMHEATAMLYEQKAHDEINTDLIVNHLRGKRITYEDYRAIRDVLDAACDRIRVHTGTIGASAGSFEMGRSLSDEQIQEYLLQFKKHFYNNPPDEEADIEFIEEKEMEI